jgi:hypothetical protein
LILVLIAGPDAADVAFPEGCGALGFLAGVTFSGVLSIVEGRRSFDKMSLGRIAGWGAVGGLLVSGIFALAVGLEREFLVLGPVFALVGAGSAGGTLALARKAGEPELLDARADKAEVDPAEDVTHQLP